LHTSQGLTQDLIEALGDGLTSARDRAGGGADGHLTLADDLVERVCVLGLTVLVLRLAVGQALGVAVAGLSTGAGAGCLVGGTVDQRVHVHAQAEDGVTQ